MNHDQQTVQIGKNKYGLHERETAAPGLMHRDQYEIYPRAEGSFIGFYDDGIIMQHQLLSPLPDQKEAGNKKLSFGFGILGSPQLEITTEHPHPAYLSVLMQDVLQICEARGLNVERPFAIRLTAGDTELEYGYNHQQGKPASYGNTRTGALRLFGFGFRPPEHIPRTDEHLRALSEHLMLFPAGGGSCLWAYASLNQKGEEQIVQPEPETMLKNASISLYFPDRVCDAADFTSL